MDLFEEEKEYYISKIPKYYYDVEKKIVSPRWRGIWEAFFSGVCRSILHSSTVPSNASEEDISRLKKALRHRIDIRYPAKPAMNEETEPAE